MRLKCIKLAGFKSFVDPTTVKFPSNLCAVVGPNGCGKSNIIDAVRWVMGESSAKHLRGESMADVIFNGSGGRKPVGQASIELVFDNSEGNLGGEYAKYAEIAVKRKVTRDGQSNYYLNGNKCRRRDITDIFLGTGLGPRSYAIIEQGMISNLIEAKPDELRVYIEEAAGISKYKERRRETENRMNHTRENLERLTDIREELGRQIQRLERQAKAAEKYTELKKEERQVKAELQALRWRELDRQLQQQKKVITEKELQVEGLVTERSHCDTVLEKCRTSHTERSDKLNEAQAHYYGEGAEVARLEQAIQHEEEKARNLQRELEETERNFSESEHHLKLDRQRRESLQEELESLTPQLASVTEQDRQSAEQLQGAEQRMQSWQTTWDDFNQSAQKPRQQSEVQQSRIQHLEQVLVRLSQRIDTLENEAKAFAEDPAEDEIASLQSKLAEAEKLDQQWEQELGSLTGQLEQEKRQQAELTGKLNEGRTSLQQNLGRKASLEALQQAALAGNSGVAKWIENLELQQKPRLAEQVTVEPGWERAVETVLGEYLQAIQVEQTDELVAKLDDFAGGTLILATLGETRVTGSGGLAQKVIQGNVGCLLQGVWTAENLQDALSRRAGLKDGESLITREGIWISRDWLRVSKDTDQAEGVLQRKQSLKALEEQITSGQQVVARLEEEQKACEQRLQSMDDKRKTINEERSKQQKAYAELRSELSANQVKVRQYAERKERLNRDIQEANEQRKAEQSHLAEARQLLSRAIESMEQDTQRREELLRQRDETRAELDSARQAARHNRDKQHELAIREKSVTTQLQSVKESIQRLESQLARLEERKQQLIAASVKDETPGQSLKEQLEERLEKRLKAETVMADVRKSVEEVEFRMRETEQKRASLENQLQDKRSELEKLKMQSQELRTRADTIAEQIAEHHFELAKLLESLEDEMDLLAWEEKLTGLENRIQRLGPINLAAIEEYKTESERKSYLDAQNEELEEALRTLEEAIRAIDKETRTRFKETFDNLNTSLQALFPRIFGGGHAYLELTGEDLLDTGVAIMARPPGKKNSTIHLLSGGEKAMTAIALVFSIFQLNPAPFCMLDEVDAPLDDANVGRYARMVHEMSEKVQFIYITHNKIAMEMAHQLMGVTMHEPGVSRLVTVDVDQAVELAGA